MPDLRAKETSLKASIAALDAQLFDREAYLKLAEDIETFLARLRQSASTASIEERQKVLRSVVREVLIGPDKIVIRHTIPVSDPPRPPGYLLCLRSHDATLRRAGIRRSERLPDQRNRHSATAGPTPFRVPARWR